MQFKARRWLRFSLRSFLVLVALVATWLGWRAIRERERQELIHEIQALGGLVHIERPKWIPSFPGERVTSVTLPYTVQGNFHMERRNVFPGFEVHRIPECTTSFGVPAYSGSLCETIRNEEVFIVYGTTIASALR